MLFRRRCSLRRLRIFAVLYKGVVDVVCNRCRYRRRGLRRAVWHRLRGARSSDRAIGSVYRGRPGGEECGGGSPRATGDERRAFGELYSPIFQTTKLSARLRYAPPDEGSDLRWQDASHTDSSESPSSISTAQAVRRSDRGDIGNKGIKRWLMFHWLCRIHSPIPSTR